MRRAFGAVLLLLAASCAAPVYYDDDAGVTTRSYYGFSVSTTNAPPPPDIHWVRRPDLDRIPGTNVYVVDEPSYDVYFFRGTYWLTNQGYWYQAGGYGGPFAVVDVRTVPRQVLRVPDPYWRHSDGFRRSPRHRDWDGRS